MSLINPLSPDPSVYRVNDATYSREKQRKKEEQPSQEVEDPAEDAASAVHDEARQKEQQGRKKKKGRDGGDGSEEPVDTVDISLTGGDVLPVKAVVPTAKKPLPAVPHLDISA